MERLFKHRVIFFFCIVILMLCSGAVRVYYLCVVEKEKLSSQADHAQSASVNIANERGNIIDRNGISFTNTDTMIKIVIQPSIFRKSKSYTQKNVDFLAKITGEDKMLLDSRFEKLNSAFTLYAQSKYEKTLAKVQIEGITVVHAKQRYSDTRIAEHLLGYLDSAGDKGVSGFEATLQMFLKGGGSSVLDYTRDAKNEAISGLGVQLAKKDGKCLSVTTTLDFYIQNIVEQVLDQKMKADPKFKGAVVVSDTSDGSIVAMSSRPNFSRENIPGELKNTAQPFLNRATSAYNLGSVFKIVDTATWLEYFSSEPPIGVCKGYIKVGSRIIKCNNINGHGYLDLQNAFRESCNPYFVQLGISMGYQKVLQMANNLGLGKTTGIQGVFESQGSLPQPSDFYNDGDVANLILGQGKITATPLQVIAIVNAVVNNGQLIRPWILQSVSDSQNVKVSDFPKTGIGKAFSEKTAKRLKTLMIDTVANGTGNPAELANGVGAGGKTGSAESGTGGKTHAWFAGFFPAENPRYSIVVVAENGGHGGKDAGPIFKQIAEKMIEQGLS